MTAGPDPSWTLHCGGRTCVHNRISRRRVEEKNEMSDESTYAWKCLIQKGKLFSLPLPLHSRSRMRSPLRRTGSHRCQQQHLLLTRWAELLPVECRRFALPPQSVILAFLLVPFCCLRKRTGKRFNQHESCRCVCERVRVRVACQRPGCAGTGKIRRKSQAYAVKESADKNPTQRTRK